jgi:hypothetical protein
LPDAEWPGDAPRSRGSAKKKTPDYVAEALHDDDDDSDPDAMRQQRRGATQPQFIDAEVIQPKKKTSGSNKKKR